MLRGELVLVGSESLEERGTDFFTPLLRGALVELGIRLVARVSVRDEEQEMVGLLRNALARSNVVVVVGRLGQEERDLTRKVLAKVTKRRLVLAEPVTSGGKPFLIPFGATLISSTNGETPALLLEAKERWIMAFPRPLAEAESCLLRTLPLLAERGGFVAESGVLLRTCGLDVDGVQSCMKGIMLSPGATLSLIPSVEGVDLELFTQSREERMAVEVALRERLQGYIYGACGETLEGVLARLLKSSAARLAVAESCTGGGIGERITRIPGSSDFFDRSLVTYSNRAKMELLGVDEGLLTRHGAVSPQVALAMAEGIRKHSGTDIGLSVTGIAGPSGGSDQKPLGLVYIALSAPSGNRSWSHRFHGDRGRIQGQAAGMALNHLRRFLQGFPEEGLSGLC